MPSQPHPEAAEAAVAGDFDYIGTGGFLLECSGPILGRADDDDGRSRSGTLGVTREQAALMVQNCPFFERCLAGGGGGGGTAMREATDRVVRKPDWPLAIGRHMVELLTKGRTAVPTLDAYRALMEAGDQALVDLRLSSMVNYDDACAACSDHAFLSLIRPDNYRFRLTANVRSREWVRLLDERGVLLFREGGNFVVQLYRGQGGEGPPDGGRGGDPRPGGGGAAGERQRAHARRKLDCQRSDFLVHAERALQAIFEIQKELAGEEDTPGDADTAMDPSREAFSVYFETTESIPREHHQLIDRLAGGEAYIRTCADAVEYRAEGYTVRGPPDVLVRALRPLQHGNVLRCSIRIDHPSPDTLGRFVNACQRCRDYPATLGMDAASNRYFCIKSIRDVLDVLEYLADYSTTAWISGDFEIWELSSEDEPF